MLRPVPRRRSAHGPSVTPSGMGSSIEARRDEAAVGARVRHCPRILRLSLAVVDEAENAAPHGGLGAGTTLPLLGAQPIELPRASHPRNAPAGPLPFDHVLPPLMAPGLEAAFLMESRRPVPVA